MNQQRQPVTGRIPHSPEDRSRLEQCLGRLYVLDTEASPEALDAILEPIWQEANPILAALFGNQSLQFHMFRQPSYRGAVVHLVEDLPGTELKTKYLQLISLFRDDLELALKRLDGPLKRFA